MSAWTEPASHQDNLPRIMKYCKVCQQDTPHEIRRWAGLRATICVACIRRALAYDLDRD